MEIIKKQGSALTQSEFEQINKILDREFTVASQPREFLKNRLFFLLYDNQDIASLCSLVDVNPVNFNNKQFSLKGIVHVVSTIKGKGYGKKVVTAMINYLQVEGITAIGFTHKKNKAFYEKCGFLFPLISTNRFITKDGEKNKDGQIVFCIQGKDHFIDKVVANTNSTIVLPKANLW